MRGKAAFCAVVASCLLGAGAVQAASLGFSPGAISVSLAPGASVAASVKTSIANAPTNFYTVNFVLRPAGGTIPSSWLSTQPVMIPPNAQSVAVPLTIQVPAGAAEGVYTSTLRTTVFSSSIPLDAAGANVAVTLTVERKCAAAPALTISEFGPTEFAAPNNKVELVRLAGSVALPEGCTMKQASYRVTDEYGEYGSAGALAVGPDGSIVLSFPIMVARRGNDKDGRTYFVSIFAEDEAGVGTQIRTITIGHDQGREK
jgi:hypothetical protein